MEVLKDPLLYLQIKRGYGVHKQGGALVGAKLKEHMHKQHKLGNAKIKSGYYSY